MEFEPNQTTGRSGLQGKVWLSHGGDSERDSWNLLAVGREFQPLKYFQSRTPTTESYLKDGPYMCRNGQLVGPLLRTWTPWIIVVAPGSVWIRTKYDCWLRSWGKRRKSTSWWVFCGSSMALLCIKLTNLSSAKWVSDSLTSVDCIFPHEICTVVDFG